MLQMKSLPALVVVLAAVAASCSGDGSNLPTSLPSLPTTTLDGSTTTSEVTTSSTIAGSETTTTVGEVTSTVAPSTTTTVLSSTTTEPEVDRALAASDAIASAVPPDWTVRQSDTLENSDGDLAERLVSVCAPGHIEKATLDDISVAAYSTIVEAPASLPDRLFAPTASFESRVFESEEAAAAAFVAMEIMTRRADGRACIASAYISWLVERPPIDASLELSIEDVAIPGANFGVRLVWTTTVRARAVEFIADVVAHRDGDFTLVGAFSSVNDPFPPLVGGVLFGAGI